MNSPKTLPLLNIILDFLCESKDMGSFVLGHMRLLLRTAALFALGRARLYSYSYWDIGLVCEETCPFSDDGSSRCPASLDSCVCR